MSSETIAETGRLLAANVVILHVRQVLRAAGCPEDLVERVRDENYLQTGFMKLELLPELDMIISLALADKDFKMKYAVPSNEHANELIDKINYMQMCAKIYWREWQKNNADLAQKIVGVYVDCELREDEGLLGVNLNYPHRIACVNCVMDKNGEVYVHKDVYNKN